jgi:hypothetical protein
MKMNKLSSPLMGLLLLVCSSLVSSDNVSRIRRQRVQVESADLEKFVLQDDDVEMLKGVRASSSSRRTGGRSDTHFFFPNAPTPAYPPNYRVGTSKKGNNVWDHLLLSMDTSPTRAPNPTISPSSAPTNLMCMGLSRSEAMLSILSEISDEMKLLQPNTPQGVAYLWMLDGDPAMVDPCTYPTVKQRFALASFFYSAGGSFWTSDTAWLSAANECEWMGVSCDGEMVTGLRLGTYIPCRLFVVVVYRYCRWFEGVHKMSLEKDTNVFLHFLFLLTSLINLNLLSQWKTT